MVSFSGEPHGNLADFQFFIIFPSPSWILNTLKTGLCLTQCVDCSREEHLQNRFRAPSFLGRAVSQELLLSRWGWLINIIPGFAGGLSILDPLSLIKPVK